VEVEVLGVGLPGRDARFKEPPFQRLPPLIAACAAAVLPELQPPFAIYGHSLGALLGFSFARELRRRSCSAPLHLFVSGRRAPQLPERSPLHQLPDPQFLDQLRRLGGIPDAVFQDAELMAHYLPVLRADLAVTETAEITSEEPLTCPITALGGVTDDRATIDELDAWQVQTSSTFERETFPGGHFFIQSERTAFLGSLSRRLSRITAAL
jgi:medium-chain acyl-[acyl-carrier-protein] hydrolase